MTIADDMRAASLGELNRVRAQLKTANEEIEQLRLDLLKANHDLSQRTHGMFVAQEAGKDLARQLDKANERNAADLDVLSAIQYELDRMTESRDQWKRIALAYRCDRNACFGPFDLSRYISGWSIARRMGRAAKEIVDRMQEDRK